MSNFSTEPTLDQIDDYNDNESSEKKSVIKLVIIALLIIGAIFAVLRVNFNDVDDYVGTPENPGINTAKTY
jgi:hypothetical protein